jgi:hypothetical protein
MPGRRQWSTQVAPGRRSEEVKTIGESRRQSISAGYPRIPLHAGLASDRATHLTLQKRGPQVVHLGATL